MKIMITEKEIVQILRNYSGYIDRSRSEECVSEVNYELVAKDILSKLHQPTVIEPLPNPEHCSAKPLCDDRFCLKGERCNYDERQ
jgi:hypothetical protein